MSRRSFEGRVAVVTGAASGIGFGIAQRFAEEGARVALIAIDAERCRMAEEQIAGAGELRRLSRRREE